MGNGTTLNVQIVFHQNDYVMVSSFFWYLSGWFIGALEVQRDLDKEYTDGPTISLYILQYEITAQSSAWQR